MQAFAPEAARQLHAVPAALAAICLTVYMVASAGGMVLGGFLAADPARCERIVGIGFGIAARVALALGFAPLAPLAVPVLFGAMGFGARASPGRRATCSSSASTPDRRDRPRLRRRLLRASTSARRSRR